MRQSVAWNRYKASFVCIYAPVSLNSILNYIFVRIINVLLLQPLITLAIPLAYTIVLDLLVLNILTKAQLVLELLLVASLSLSGAS